MSAQPKRASPKNSSGDFCWEFRGCERRRVRLPVPLQPRLLLRSYRVALLLHRYVAWPIPLPPKPYNEEELPRYVRIVLMQDEFPSYASLYHVPRGLHLTDADYFGLHDCAVMCRTCHTAHVPWEHRLHTRDAAQKALLWAAKNDRLDVAAKSIQYHGSTGTADEAGYTPLMCAANSGHIGVVRLLLESGADVNYNSNVLRVDAISLATASGHLETVELLISYGAHVGLRRDMHNFPPSPIEIAASCGMAAIAEKLLAYNATGNNLGYLSLMSGDVKTAKLCGGYGLGKLEVNAALREAVWRCDQNVLRSIFQNYADVNLEETNHFGTALQLATLRNDMEVASMLINHGSDIDARNIQGSTPLFMAMAANNLAAVELLLLHGSNLEIRGTFGQTALLYAVSYCSHDIVRALLTAGASTAATLESGETALDLVRARGDEKLAEMLNAQLGYAINPIGSASRQEMGCIREPLPSVADKSLILHAEPWRNVLKTRKSP